MTNEIIFFDATEPRRERMRAGGARAKQEPRDEAKPVDHAPHTVSYSFNAPTPVAPETNREEVKPVLRQAAQEPEQVAEPVAKQQETTGISADELDAYDSVRCFGAVEMTPADGGDTICVDLGTGLPLDKTADCPDTAVLHAEIYKARADVNAIMHSREEATLAASRAGVSIRPFLDDFAQIVGMTLRSAEYDPDNQLKTAKKVVRKLKRRDAVLLDHNGALCVGSDRDEAGAVKLVAEKGCKAWASADIYGKTNACINPVESLLMRVIYKAKYSKKK